MASILPVSDLRNYNEVKKNVRQESLYFSQKTAEDVLSYLILRIMSVNGRKGSLC